jgi:hypothetical protein
MFVESMTGYIARLAEAHDVSPAMLLNRELLPRMGAETIFRTRRATVPKNSTFIYNSHVLNGAGGYPQSCVRVLEDLTGAKNLRVTTMLRLGEILSAQQLLRTHRAWCSLCFEDWRRFGSPVYEPLLWAIEPVSCCPAHQCALSVCCPHCGQVLHTLSARSRPGYCCRCQQWLGQSCDPDRKPAKAQAGSKFARSVGDLLAACIEVDSFSRDLCKANLRRCIGSLTDGSVNRFCTATGMTYDLGTNWLSTNGTIRLELLISVCTQLGLSPLRFLTEPLIDADFEHARDFVCRNTSHIKTVRPQIRIDEQLASALHAEPPISLHEIAAQLGYSSANSMRRRNPDICDQISIRYRKATIRTPAPPLFSTVPSNDTIRRALCRALAQSPRVPVRTIARNLGFRTVVSLYDRFPDLCRAFAVANRTEKAQRLAPMRAAFEAALQESPPPSVRDLAARFGCTDAALNYRFPALVAALVKRLPERKRFFDEQLLDVIQRALTEEPPPSMKSVAMRAGKGAPYLRVLHPELFEVIQNRHAAQKKLDAVRRRIAYRAEITCAVTELLQRGITPSRRKVSALILHPSMKSSHIIDQQIVATLREMEASLANIATSGRT